MSGYLDQAAATLNSAAQQVPVETLLGVEGTLQSLAGQIQTAGGQVAEDLTRKALAMQSDAREFAGRLNGLRQELEQAAQRVLASGS